MLTLGDLEELGFQGTQPFFSEAAIGSMMPGVIHAGRGHMVGIQGLLGFLKGQGNVR